MVHFNFEKIKKWYFTKSGTQKVYMLISTGNITQKKTQAEDSSLHIHSELRERLIYALETEKCYLDINLTIDKLAKSLHSNREYLSQTIHLFFGKSYINLINGYRVKEATQILENISNGNQKKLNMLEVANASGFKSTSTFNPAFRKESGITPKVFKRKFLQ